MPTYFEFKRLDDGYHWNELSSHNAASAYAKQVLNIPEECLKFAKCYPQESCLGIMVEEDRHLIRRKWFHRLVQTHTYRRTDLNLMVFY